MPLPSPTNDTTVVVSGASSGIGAAIAKELASRGYGLTITARREQRLRELADQLMKEHQIDVEVIRADLSDRTQRRELVEKLQAGKRRMIGICNSAGFGTYGRSVHQPAEREFEQVNLNVVALHELTLLLLPELVKHDQGSILNIGSLAGFQPLPGMATYSASKAFVNTFSEALWSELAGSGVSCTVLCPGFVETEFASIAGSEHLQRSNPPFAVLPVEKIARLAVSGMIAGDRMVIPGVVNQVIGLAGRVTPRPILLEVLRRTYG